MLLKTKLPIINTFAQATNFIRVRLNNFIYQQIYLGLQSLNNYADRRKKFRITF